MTPPRVVRRVARFAIGLLLAGVAVWAVTRPGARAWTAVRRADLVLGVEVSGTLAAADSARLGPPQLSEMYQFRIAMMIPEGAEVTPGTPVLAFDSTELERQLAATTAAAEAAAKELERKEAELAVQAEDERLQLAEAEARRRKAEFAAGAPVDLVAAADLRFAALDLELARAEVAFRRERLVLLEGVRRSALAALSENRRRAEARVRELGDAIARMIVLAPRSGPVVYVVRGGDEKKKVGDACWRGESVLEIPDLVHMRGEGEVDEVDAGKVREDMPVRLRLDAHPDVEFTGRLRSVARTVGRRSWRDPARVVRVTLVLDRTDRQRMRPGMRFRGTIETQRVESALVVPARTVLPAPDGPVVYRKAWLGAERVPVRIGRRSAELVEIEDGLAAGDRVAQRPVAEAGTR